MRRLRSNKETRKLFDSNLNGIRKEVATFPLSTKTLSPFLPSFRLTVRIPDFPRVEKSVKERNSCVDSSFRYFPVWLPFPISHECMPCFLPPDSRPIKVFQYTLSQFCRSEGILKHVTHTRVREEGGRGDTTIVRDFSHGLSQVVDETRNQ